MTTGPILLWRRLLAEFLGSAFLAAVVIGAGIAAQNLSPGQTGLQLLEDAAMTTAARNALPRNSASSRRHSRMGPVVTRPS